ncbi:ATP-grasp domain-containing protein [Acetilactobacillus jinshanensis]|nr:ATP-grasp domain-containing protein [Acetilactobacillus jinshanensis]URL61413.1 ATP-grasp domain-containing protein [uncultured bacterium]
MNAANSKILIIGSGPSSIGNENESDAASFQIITQLIKHHVTPFVIDDNAFSVTLSLLDKSQVFINKITIHNVIQAIKKARPDSILPTLGGKRAVKITQFLLARGVLTKYHVKIVGISDEALKLVSNPLRFGEVVHDCNEPTITSTIVSSFQDAELIADKIGYPVMIKSLSPRYRIRRRICKDPEKLRVNLKKYLNDSEINKCIIEPDITGYQEFSMIGVRDDQGTRMIINSIEDIDAFGIHPGDSLTITPIQTLTDPQYQRLRNATLKIMDTLDINGFCGVQFAFNRSGNYYFITKVVPYYTRAVALSCKASEYPLLEVYTDFLMGQNFSTLKLSNEYDPKTKCLEPSLDHVLVKIPLWQFKDIKTSDQHLGSLMQSVGSSIGVGRTIEEALLKALRSSQFSPKDVLPNRRNMSDDELIDQLIHPQASRILVLIEALRRHYPVHDLAELTKIQPFYFYKLKRLLAVEKNILNKPGNIDTIKRAHESGFGDGMLAETWNQSLAQIRDADQKGETRPTYKQIEPSAGEFIQHTRTYYSSYEHENESAQLSDRSALVIGRGGNQLGPNTSADYYTAETLIQMHKLGFKTIIINNNPNAVSLIPRISDKQYIEPVQLGNITDIIHLEKPQLIVVPGNRHFLLRQLTRRFPDQAIILPPDQKTGVTIPKRASVGLDFFVSTHQQQLITPMKLISRFHSELKYVNEIKPFQINDDKLLHTLKHQAIHVINQSNWKGLVQVLFKTGPNGYSLVGIRPLRTTETVFLNQISNVNWIRALIQLYTHQLTPAQFVSIFKRLKVLPAKMTDTFPFKQLSVVKPHLKPKFNNNHAVGARLTLL